MLHSHGWVAALAVLAGTTGCGGGNPRRAESVPAEPLPLAADTVSLPWGQLPEAAWLGVRTWVVVGADHDAVAIVDFGAKTARPLGGDKNPELAKPFAVFAVADTAFVSDWGKQRTTLWTASGTMVGAIAAPAALRGVLPKARDAAGQLYFEVRPIAGPDGSGLKDSAAVVRSDPAMTRFDTLLRLTPADVAEVTEQRGKRFERLVFSGDDWWGVRPDGRIWVARVRKNEVATVRDRKETRGERLPDPVLEVTRNDKLQYINTFPEDLRPMAEKLPYSPFKPNFERGFASADGLVWLRKAKPALDSVRRYHLVDTAGALRRVFTTIGNGVIVAAGSQAALLVEQHKDGLRLMELRLPAATQPAAPAPR